MTDENPSLEALASFGPRLSSAYFLGGPETSGAVGDFVDLVYRTGWVDMSFDWTAWEEGKTFLADQDRIARATPDQLQKLITSIARMDRLSEGYLDGRLEDGTLQAIVDRAKVLLAGIAGEGANSGRLSLPTELNRLPIESVLESDLDFAVVCGLHASDGFRRVFMDIVLPDTEFRDFVGAWRSVYDPVLGESDIVVIFQNEAKERLALLIEDKIGAVFQPDQAGRYRERGQGGVSGGAWHAFKTCLLGPKAYLLGSESSWDCLLSIERLVDALDQAVDRSPLDRFVRDTLFMCVNKYEAKGVVADERATLFWRDYTAFCMQKYSDLAMSGLGAIQSKAPPWPRFNAKALGPKVRLEHKPTQGFVDLTFNFAPEPVVRQVLQHELTMRRFIRKVGSSVALGIQVPKINHLEAIAPQMEDVERALGAARELLEVWERNRQGVSDIEAASPGKPPSK